MHIPKPQHLPNLPITQRRLKLAQHPRDLRTRTLLRQKLLRRHIPNSNRIVCSIKHLEPQPALPNRQVTDLPEISRVNVTPRVAFPGRGIPKVGGEVFLVFVRLDHVADSEGVDVCFEAPCKGACCLLAADFG